MDISNGIVCPSQEVYDNFNSFIFSDDRKIFAKLATKILFFNQTTDLPGDIVECGVFKGSGLFVWLKLLSIYAPNSIKKVIGFDFYNQNFISELNLIDKESMKDVFNRCPLEENQNSKEYIEKLLKSAQIPSHMYDLVQGDICLTSKSYTKDRPGFRISILYMDLDLDTPTYEALCNFWDRVVPGGFIIFDEYGYHKWTESNAVDRFIRDKKIRLTLISVPAPTAYIIKPF